MKALTNKRMINPVRIASVVLWVTLIATISHTGIVIHELADALSPRESGKDHK
jgi:hypothetical protein